MPRLRKANACLRAARKSLDWLKNNFGGDEEWAAVPHPLVTYHKLAYLFNIAGSVEECSRALGWIKANLQTADGDLLRSAPENGKDTEKARVREKAWVALAAHRSGRYDMFNALVALLARQQGRNTGGVYDVDGEGRRLETANVRTTACAGLVFLTAGALSEARAAGRFVTQVIRSQPSAKKFYLRLDSLGRPVTKYPKGKMGRYLISHAKGRAELSHFGIPIVFLTRLHLATGEEAWLETAMDYYARAGEFDEESLRGLDSGPYAWGAAALYAITRRRFYYDRAEEVAQAWVDRQKGDGSWGPRGAPLPTAIALTVEGALSLLETLREAQ